MKTAAKRRAEANPAEKGKQGCWTCKRRKIGCDKGVPSCDNCRRTGRDCLGYSVRLVWPDQPDGRRRRLLFPPYDWYYCPPSLIVSYGSQFLNTTFDDLRQPSWPSINDIINRVIGAHPLSLRPSACLSSYPHLLGSEPSILQYCDRISRMISTIDTTNGFRSELIPMALASSSAASLALCNAILAVSAFHKCGVTAALPFKAKAVRCLSSSLSSETCGGAAIMNTQLATSMMLCVYSVFDETDGNWYSHLDGAKAMFYHLSAMSGGKLRYQFLYTWLIYHEVLGAFSQPLQHIQHKTSSIDLLTDVNFDKTAVIGSLGCSLEVLEAIHCLNKIRCAIMAGPPEITEALILERRLVSLTQCVDPIDSPPSQNVGAEERPKVLLTAELYRIAALLYHHRVHAYYLDRCKERNFYLKQAFQILCQLPICTSPWPLFVIASEAESDDQRLVILRILDRMDEARKIGNIFVLRDIIQSLWKQQDLAADCKTSGNQPGWSNSWDLLFLDSKMAVPWFI
ncbi:fungal-specific transcription factor domain-containing protein [Talaromyces proteolyticus]|uniref:Fungal-specific transcription factor domain-containing protein n=1 Tax=Talaromyces proteolyticus TaxID=1131652 RepID=A0AAD4PSK5_9EURO|nr:fungal-specific transcription factor domain-containing protein [Talaromyces proteolyticus]KAH8691551.1 fungal-specific transcription factor domain-containing protein [Talaromyces proteolyticus]